MTAQIVIIFLQSLYQKFCFSLNVACLNKRSCLIYPVNMKTCDLERYIKKNKAKFMRIRVKLLSAQKKRLIRRKPLDKTKQELLMKMTLRRWENGVKNKEIVRTGKREYELRV